MADTQNQYTKFIKCLGGFLKEVDIFCYLGDLISSEASCSESIDARMRKCWKKFRELLSLLIKKVFL